MVNGIRVTSKQALAAAAVTLAVHLIFGILAFTVNRDSYGAVAVVTGTLGLILVLAGVLLHSREMEARWQAQQNAIADFMQEVSRQLGTEPDSATLDRIRGLDPRD